jgi:gamma-glutamyl hercynylcysteine S-oxide synthase
MTSRPRSDRSNPTSDLRQSQIADWMQQCRAATLALFEGMDHPTFCHQAHPDFSPVGWHLGHVAYTEALWLLQRSAGHPPLYPHYHRLFAQNGLPKGDRIHLPPLADVLDYLAIVRSKVFNYLQIAPLDQQERLWRWILQHESQHCETIAIVLALQKRDQKPHSKPKTQNSKPKTLPPMLPIPAGVFEQGNESLDALDNERPAHQVYLETYWIDRHPVTCGEYRSFMQANGYHESRWWTVEGWQWLQHNPVTQPLYWTDDPIYDYHPVCGVSWYEADAYARFVGKRLPTESEWEKAASWNPKTQTRSLYPWGNQFPDATRGNHSHLLGMTSPIDRYPQSPSGCHDLLGNVWEWTNSWFDRYSGFEGYPYPGYSQTYFDGTHRVLKGGSWATRPWTLRCAFRNWYQPHVREIFAGFRCVRDEEL